MDKECFWLVLTSVICEYGLVGVNELLHYSVVTNKQISNALCCRTIEVEANNIFCDYGACTQ